jgi:hypothetical protein
MEWGGEFNSVIPMSQFMFDRIDTPDGAVVTDAFIQQPDVLAQTKRGMADLAKSDRITIGNNGKVTAVRDYRGNSSHAFRLMTNVMGMSPNQAAAHYARTESPEFKQWSGGNPLVESVANADIRGCSTCIRKQYPSLHGRPGCFGNHGGHGVISSRN